MHVFLWALPAVNLRPATLNDSALLYRWRIEGEQAEWPPETTHAEKIAWAGGFFEGEGCIMIHYGSSGSARGRRYCLRLMVQQKDRRPLELLQQLFGGSINTAGKDEKQIWQWTVSTRAAANVLEQIEPWLVGKRDEAQLAIEYQKRRKGKGPGGRVGRTPAEHEWDEWAKQELSRMKRRLPNQTPPSSEEAPRMESLWT